MYVRIDGRWVYLWRAVDAEGEVLDVLVQSKRDKRAAIKLIRKLLTKQGYAPGTVVTDHLRAYSAALPISGGRPAYSLRTISDFSFKGNNSAGDEKLGRANPEENSHSAHN